MGSLCSVLWKLVSQPSASPSSSTHGLIIGSLLHVGRWSCQCLAISSWNWCAPGIARRTQRTISFLWLTVKAQCYFISNQTWVGTVLITPSLSLSLSWLFFLQLFSDTEWPANKSWNEFLKTLLSSWNANELFLKYLYKTPGFSFKKKSIPHYHDHKFHGSNCLLL